MKKTALLLVLMMATVSASAEVVSYWNFEETTQQRYGNLTCDVVEDQVGTLNLVSMYGDQIQSTDVKWGQGAASSSSTHYYTSNNYITGESTTNYPKSEVSYAMWIKANSPTNWTGAFATHLSNMRAEFYAGGLYVYDVPGGNTYNYIAGVADGNWHFLVIACSESANQTKFYLDGQLLADRTTGYSGATARSEVYFGTSSASNLGKRSAMLIDDTAIFDTALTAAEVAAYNSTGIPEPATMGLLAVGAILGLRRRRI